MSLLGLNKNYLINSNCLHALERIDDNSVDLIYLDPPWNTGNDFIDYPLFFQDNYEKFIYAVLQQAKRILKKTGNLVFYSIPSLNINFHNLITPVFGIENFKAEFIIPKKSVNIRNKMFTHNHETILCYSSSDKAQFFPYIKKNEDEIENMFPLYENGKRYKLSPLDVQSDVTYLNFEWNGFSLPPNKVWRYSKKRMNKLDEMGKIYFKDDMKFPMLKVYSDEFNLRMVDSVWSDISAYSKKQLIPGEQNERLLERIIKLCTQKGDTVLDPFCGTSVSGKVAIENQRKWIGIESYESVFEVSREKLKDFDLILMDSNKVNEAPVIWADYTSHNLSQLEVIKEIIQKGETERIEFKEAYIFNDYNDLKDNSLPNKIMKEIAAFLNSKYGGSIYLGVKDNGSIRGLKKDIETVDPRKKNKDGLELAITSKVKDTFGGSIIDLVSVYFFEIESLQIAEIKVSPAEKPIFIDNDFYVRNGTQALSLKPKELFDLMKKRRKI
jgi:DNA modification methylase